MTLKAFDFDLPVPPKELHPNKLRSTSAAARMRRKKKRDYQMAVLAELSDQERHFPKGSFPIQQALVVSRFGLPSGLKIHQHDRDNLIAWLKFAIDVFEKRGILENDRLLHYKTPEQVISPRPFLRLAFMVVDDYSNELLDKAVQNAKSIGNGVAEQAWLETVLDFRKRWGE